MVRLLSILTSRGEFVFSFFTPIQKSNMIEKNSYYLDLVVRFFFISVSVSKGQEWTQNLRFNMDEKSFKCSEKMEISTAASPWQL